MNIVIKELSFQMLFKNVIIFILIFFGCIALNFLVTITLGKGINSYVLITYYALFLYLLTGCTIKKLNKKLSSRMLVLLGFIFILFERLIWLIYGCIFYIGSPDGLLINAPLIMFIQDEIVPFFSYIYIFGVGIISIALFTFIYKKVA